MNLTKRQMDVHVLSPGVWVRDVTHGRVSSPPPQSLSSLLRHIIAPMSAVTSRQHIRPSSTPLPHLSYVAGVFVYHPQYNPPVPILQLPCFPAGVPYDPTAGPTGVQLGLVLDACSIMANNCSGHLETLDKKNVPDDDLDTLLPEGDYYFFLSHGSSSAEYEDFLTPYLPSPDSDNQSTISYLRCLSVLETSRNSTSCMGQHPVLRCQRRFGRN